MKDTILVTGGAGFIGSNFVRQWIAQQPGRLVNLDKLTYAGSLDSLAGVIDDARHVFVRGDVGDASLLESVLREHRPRAVVHFAAESHVDRSITGPAPFVQTNVVGTVSMLEAARTYWEGLGPSDRDAFRFLHVSTDEVYGSLGAEGIFTEDSPYRPNSPYAASKAASDHFVRAFHRTYGLPTITTNATNNYGPRQYPEKLIPVVIMNALAGRPIPVYGDGQQVRNWLHVEDHCRALRVVLDKGEPGESYCIGGDWILQNLKLVQSVCGMVDEVVPKLPNRPSSDLIQSVPDRPGHDRRYAVDSSKVLALGWKLQIGFLDGLRSTVQWYVDNRAWAESEMDRR